MTCVLQQSPQTPLIEQFQEGSLIGEAAGSDGGEQSLLAEISENDVEVLRQREEALLQIEVSKLTLGSFQSPFYENVLMQRSAVSRPFQQQPSEAYYHKSTSLYTAVKSVLPSL